MTATATATGIGRDYCRGCATASTQRFAGWATADGHENGVRPRAFYRQCDTCGMNRLVLGHAGRGVVDDAEGLCRNILKAWMNKHASGNVGATGKPTADYIDVEDALSYLQVEIWHLYLRWDPAQGNGSFLSYASGLLPRRLISWSRDTSGEASGADRYQRHVHPKAHAASVSVSYEQIVTNGADDRTHTGVPYDIHNVGDGSYESLGTFTADHAETLSPDLYRALTEGSGGAARDQRAAVERAPRGAATTG